MNLYRRSGRGRCRRGVSASWDPSREERFPASIVVAVYHSWRVPRGVRTGAGARRLWNRVNRREGSGELFRAGRPGGRGQGSRLERGGGGWYGGLGMRASLRSAA